MTDAEWRESRIARLNAEFRRQAGLLLSDGSGTPGRWVVTAGVAAVGRRAEAEIITMVRQSSCFEPGNDSYGAHDFGTVSTPAGEEVFCKIDYYSDAAIEYGADNPGDPERSFRVLTFMLAAEY